MFRLGMELVASLALLALLASVVHAGPLRERHTCPRVCDASRCPPPSQLACYYGRAAAGCGCCAVCAAGEGDACGERSDGGLPCGEGLLCDSVPGKLDGPRSTCVCASSGPVCGSDGRTYPSVCRLGAENRRAELAEGPLVLLIQRVSFNGFSHNSPESHQPLWIKRTRGPSASSALLFSAPRRQTLGYVRPSLPHTGPEEAHTQVLRGPSSFPGTESHSSPSPQGRPPSLRSPQASPSPAAHTAQQPHPAAARP
uniref:IGFBP N-terminal domain-containing protein n=1 Tax=Cyclopterus lumpus TaxID=8103 RepID=A0A8C2WK47_CYCLU